MIKPTTRRKVYIKSKLSAQNVLLWHEHTCKHLLHSSMTDCCIPCSVISVVVFQYQFQLQFWTTSFSSYYLVSVNFFSVSIVILQFQFQFQLYTIGHNVQESNEVKHKTYCSLSEMLCLLVSCRDDFSSLR